MKHLGRAAIVGGALLAAGALSVPTTQAKPGGCLKYGAAGALAGHAAGGHGFKGAVAGCALGWYERRRYNRMMRERANRPPGQSCLIGSQPGQRASGVAFAKLGRRPY